MSVLPFLKLVLTMASVASTWLTARCPIPIARLTKSTFSCPVKRLLFGAPRSPESGAAAGAGLSGPACPPPGAGSTESAGAPPPGASTGAPGCLWRRCDCRACAVINRTVLDPTPQMYEPTGDFRTPPNKVKWAMAEFNGFARQ